MLFWSPQQFRNPPPPPPPPHTCWARCLPSAAVSFKAPLQPFHPNPNLQPSQPCDRHPPSRQNVDFRHKLLFFLFFLCSEKYQNDLVLFVLQQRSGTLLQSRLGSESGASCVAQFMRFTHRRAFQNGGDISTTGSKKNETLWTKHQGKNCFGDSHICEVESLKGAI